MNEPLEISGWESKTSLGTTIFGAVHNDSILWKFTDVGGNVTYLALSHEAMRAMASLSQRIMPKIPDATYALMVRLVSEVADKLTNSTKEVWKFESAAEKPENRDNG